MLATPAAAACAGGAAAAGGAASRRRSGRPATEPRRRGSASGKRCGDACGRLGGGRAAAWAALFLPLPGAPPSTLLQGRCGWAWPLAPQPAVPGAGWLMPHRRSCSTHCLLPAARLVSCPGRAPQVKNEQLLAEHAATEAALERTLQEREGLQAEHAVLQKLLVVRDEVLLRLSRAGGADSSGASSREGPPRLEAGSEGAPPGAAQAPQLRELQPGESGGSASGSRGSGTGEAGATTSSAHGGTPSVGPSSSASAGAAPGAASPRALQRRTSSSGSGGGMSRLVARQMEKIGRAHV